MSVLFNAFLSSLLVLIGYISFVVITLLFRQFTSPLRYLIGPPSPSFIYGNLKQIHDSENTGLFASWERQYGSTFVYHGFLGGARLLTTDPRALAHILGNAYNYPKPGFVRDSLATIAAGHDGILVTEGDQHRRQRKIISPAFSTSSIRAVTPIFWEKAVELRDIWLGIIDDDHESGDNELPLVDALYWMGRATLDVIGLAGFGYAFNALRGDSDELALAFATIFSTIGQFKIISVLQVWFPILRRMTRNLKTMRQTLQTVRRIGLQLISERTEGVSSDDYEKKDTLSRSGVEKGETKKYLKNDLLSVLIRANHATHPSQRLSTEEILCQISTLITAGHETTASAITWCLYALAKDARDKKTNGAGEKTILQKLRDELRTLPVVDDTMDFGAPTTNQGNEHEHRDRDKDGGLTRLDKLTSELNSLPYLDTIMRESLRLHPPATNTMRICNVERDLIPLSRGKVAPLKVQAKDRNSSIFSFLFGNVSSKARAQTRSDVIEIRKGDIINISITAVNTKIGSGDYSKSTKEEEGEREDGSWGEDAMEFKPERWLDPSPSIKSIPGLYSNTLTFLNGNGSNEKGNRGCLGWKFALLDESGRLLWTILNQLSRVFTSKD